MTKSGEEVKYFCLFLGESKTNEDMKKIFIGVSITYGALLIAGLMLFFVPFSNDPKLTFILQCSSTIILLFFGTYCLYLATSENLEFPTWTKALCYVGYFFIEAGVLFLSFELFYNYSFFKNPTLDFESFKNVNDNLTGIIWPFMIIFSATEIILPSMKLAKEWDDWTLWIIIPLGSVGGTAIVAFFLIYIPVMICMGLAEADANTSSSSDTTSDDDKTDENEEEEGEEEAPEEPEKKYCRLRSPGENYYDSEGYLRSPGENYYDGEGYLRSPGEDYYDYGN